MMTEFVMLHNIFNEQYSQRKHPIELGPAGAVASINSSKSFLLFHPLFSNPCPHRNIPLDKVAILPNRPFMLGIAFVTQITCYPRCTLIATI